MIAKLKGVLDKADLTSVVLDVNGVGYEVHIPLSVRDRLPREGEVVTLYTRLVVREDDMTLYGFGSMEERDLFLLLIQTTGIGPKTALNILSSMPAGTFCDLIAAADIKGLSRINGIGKKSAERLVVELRDKIRAFAPRAAFAGAASGDPEVETAVLALIQLGFKADAARKAVNAVLDEIPEKDRAGETLIRQALISLNS